MAKKIEFALWKKALYEAWRAFWPAFLAVVGTQLSMGAGKEDLAVWVRAVLVAGLLAGVRAVIKWARETYGDKDYSNFLYKLPV